MKRSKLSDSQIIGAVKRVESGIGIPDIFRQLGVTRRCFTNGGPSMRHGCVHDVPHEIARRRKPQIEEDVP